MKCLTSGSCQWRSLPPETAAPSPPAAQLDFRAHFCHSAPMETHAFGFTTPGQRPGGPKAISYQFKIDFAPNERKIWRRSASGMSERNTGMYSALPSLMATRAFSPMNRARL